MFCESRYTFCGHIPTKDNNLYFSDPLERVCRTAKVILIGIRHDAGRIGKDDENSNVSSTVFPLACSGVLTSDTYVAYLRRLIYSLNLTIKITEYIMGGYWSEEVKRDK